MNMRPARAWDIEQAEGDEGKLKDLCEKLLLASIEYVACKAWL